MWGSALEGRAWVYGKWISPATPTRATYIIVGLYEIWTYFRETSNTSVNILVQLDWAVSVSLLLDSSVPFGQKDPLSTSCGFDFVMHLGPLRWGKSQSIFVYAYHAVRMRGFGEVGSWQIIVLITEMTLPAFDWKWNRPRSSLRIELWWILPVVLLMNKSMVNTWPILN